ncbi:hypothetical protein BCR36DRAFT_411712 [Piromyces finnis]|uniref:L domain-like protein n=1 Tax=Piromyces finnis TaxID=1754191 RepID=A0A1Y1VBV1_9FUNG|nr:hypothetical protein BCR36DRAFT_411712 [Piromyces finnis]|eukprot:ORX51736.1 hypothetical protein BCR36DRAFT_411712 [Piromyces finnis]
MPKLKELHAINSNIKSIPNDIPSSCSLELLDLYKNEFNGFPSSITKCSNLNYLDMSINNLSSIPDDISKLKNLEILYIGQTKLKSLSNEIFKLNLNELDLDGNPDLSIEIRNFGKQVNQCDLRNINVICYEPGTCKKLIKKENPREFYPDAESVYSNKCEKPKSSPSKGGNLLLYIIGGIIIFLIICILFLWKSKNQKEDNEYNTKETRFVPPVLNVNNGNSNNNFEYNNDSSKNDIPDISDGHANSLSNGSAISIGHNTVPLVTANKERPSYKHLADLENTASKNKIDDVPPSYSEQDQFGSSMGAMNVSYSFSPTMNNPAFSSYGYNNVPNNNFSFIPDSNNGNDITMTYNNGYYNNGLNSNNMINMNNNNVDNNNNYYYPNNYNNNDNNYHFINNNLVPNNGNNNNSYNYSNNNNNNYNENKNNNMQQMLFNNNVVNNN